MLTISSSQVRPHTAAQAFATDEESQQEKKVSKRELRHAQSSEWLQTLLDERSKRREMPFMNIMREMWNRQYMGLIFAFAILSSLIAMAYVAVSGYLQHFSDSDNQFVPAAGQQEGFFGFAAWYIATTIFASYTPMLPVVYCMYGPEAMKSLRYVFPTFVFLGFIIEITIFVAPTLKLSDSFTTILPTFSAGCIVAYYLTSAVVFGRKIKKSIWPYFTLFALVLVIVASIYTILLPAVAQDYYILRLIVHPVIMGLMVSIEKWVVQYMPRPNPFSEYILLTGPMFLSAMFGRVLLFQQRELGPMVLNALLVSVEGFLLKTSSVFFQKFSVVAFYKIQQLFPCFAKSAVMPSAARQESTLSQAFTIEIMLELGALSSAAFYVFYYQAVVASGCVPISSETIVGGLFAQFVFHMISIVAAYWVIVKFYGLNIYGVWMRMDRKELIYILAFQSFNGVLGVFVLAIRSSHLFFGC